MNSSFNLELSLQDSLHKYQIVKSMFKEIKSHYFGISGFFKRNMSEDDKGVLFKGVGTLLSLNIERSVKEEIKTKHNFEETLFYKINLLNNDIMEYTERFKNSGV